MKKKYIIWVFVIICVIIAFVLGDIEIQTSIFSSQSTTKNITKQLENIQNVTGIYFRSPGESLEKELADFNSTQNTLDLRTYEFTHKDFKNTLKNLAENDVNIRIVVEDNKYKQFQNTLRVLSQDFS
jgi:acetolactate synthase small subunit